MTRIFFTGMIILLVLAAVATLAVTAMLPQIPQVLLLPVFFLILLIVFERTLWRMPLLRGLRLNAIPDLHGAWTGSLASMYQDHSEVFTVDMFIEQSWLSTVIRLRGGISESTSLAVGLFTTPSGERYLVYIYRAYPLPGHEAEINPHIGLCIQQIISEDRLSGYYIYHDDMDRMVVRGQLVITRGVRPDVPGDQLEVH